MNVSINADWARFKAHLVRSVGHENAGDWLRHAAAVMDLESRRKAAVIEAPSRVVSR